MGDTVDVSTVLDLSDDESLELIRQVLEAKPQLAPSLAQMMIPEITFAPARAITEARFSGIIKGFDANKGYGFIACEELKEAYGCDVWLHHGQCRGFGNGSQVDFAVLLGKDGKPQGFDVKNGQNGGGVPADAGWFLAAKGKTKGAAQMPGPPAPGSKRPPHMSGAEGQRYVGGIKSFTPEKGFGFINCPELFECYGRDTWLHIVQLADFQVGDMVEFTMALNKQGHPQALELTPPTQIVKKAKGKGSGGKDAFQWQSGEEGQRYTGTIKSFSAEKGFGFVECSELHASYGRDTWLHHAQLQDFQVGDTVEFTMALNKQGHPQALDLASPAPKGKTKGKGTARPSPKGVWAGYYTDVREDSQSSKGPQFERERTDETGGLGEAPSWVKPVDDTRYQGIVKSFNPDRGFGFIDCSELMMAFGRDTWVHSAQLGSFQVGDSVVFLMTLNQQGHPQAIDLEADAA